MAKETEPVPNINLVSRIASSAIVKGDVSSEDDIRIDGTVEGSVYCEAKVVIGESSFVKGAIVCSNIDIYGRVEGNIYVRDLLSAKASADIEGDVKARRFQMEIGARLNGVCKMIEESEFEDAASSVIKPLV